MKSLFVTYCEAYHNESISLRLKDRKEKLEKFIGEVEYMEKGEKLIMEGWDYVYYFNFTLDIENLAKGVL